MGIQEKAPKRNSGKKQDFSLFFRELKKVISDVILSGSIETTNGIIAQIHTVRQGINTVAANTHITVFLYPKGISSLKSQKAAITTVVAP